MVDFYSKAPVDTKASKVKKKNKGLKAILFGKYNSPQFRDVIGLRQPLKTNVAKKIAKANLRNSAIKAKLKNVWKQLSN